VLGLHVVRHFIFSKKILFIKTNIKTICDYHGLNYSCQIVSCPKCSGIPLQFSFTNIQFLIVIQLFKCLEVENVVKSHQFVALKLMLWFRR